MLPSDALNLAWSAKHLVSCEPATFFGEHFRRSADTRAPSKSGARVSVWLVGVASSRNKDGGGGCLCLRPGRTLKEVEHLPVLSDIVGTAPEVIFLFGTCFPLPTRGEACPDPGGERRGRGTQPGRKTGRLEFRGKAAVFATNRHGSDHPPGPLNRGLEAFSVGKPTIRGVLIGL